MPNVNVLQGDCLEQLRTLPNESVHCCVTSPPYWGLRDYGTASWEGGSAQCDHKTGRFERGGLSQKQSSNHGSGGDEAMAICPKCGARRVDRQIGLESTPQEYVAKLVAVFAEVRRVLRDDGTLWLNLGDSYAGYHGNANSELPTSATNGWTNGTNENKRGSALATLKPKDLCGIPWRVAFALQADGWYLRSDIIWHKPNPMPESVTDRPTKAHEYLFLLAKSERYYYDAEAIAEPVLTSGLICGGNGKSWHDHKDDLVQGNRVDDQSKKFTAFEGKRNRRSVWTIPTSPYSEAHFATFPPDLIKPCILAGSPVGGKVLDPFGGSGTTGMVALELGRNAILIELNPKYVSLIHERTFVTPGLAL